MNTVVRVASVASAAAVAAPQTTDHSVAAAMERHTKAWTSLESLLSAHSALEDRLPKETRSWFSTWEQPVPPEGCTDDPRWIAVELAIRNAHEEVNASEAELVQVRPTSLISLNTLVRFIREKQEARQEILEGTMPWGVNENGHEMEMPLIDLFVEMIEETTSRFIERAEH